MEPELEPTDGQQHHVGMNQYTFMKNNHFDLKKKTKKKRKIKH